MKKVVLIQMGIALFGAVIMFSCSSKNGGTDQATHAFNGDYTGKYLDRVSFPIGGIGAGMFCMDGTGSV